MTTLPTLTEVDAHLASLKAGGVLPRNLERLFQLRRRAYRARAMRSSLVPTIIAYNAFLPADCYFLRDTAAIAIVLHILVTGWMVLAERIIGREPMRWLQECVAVSIPVAVAAQILVIAVMSASQAAADYQSLVLIVVVFLNVNVRPDFPFALGGSLILGLAHAALLLVADLPSSTELFGAAAMAAVIYMSLAANWYMEREARHAFLRRLQDQLRRSEAQAEAERDPLTGLFNRRHLDERVPQLWSDVDGATPMAVILIDVDHFKAFNDRYGHPVGDLCLRRVAGAIEAELRNTDEIAARFGGEEFLVLLPRTDLPSAARAAERIRRAVHDLAIPHEASDVAGCVTVSLGAMAGPASGCSAAELIAGADTALYAAKRNGRNQVWPPFVTRTSAPVQLQPADRTANQA